MPSRPNSPANRDRFPRLGGLFKKASDDETKPVSSASSSTSNLFEGPMFTPLTLSGYKPTVKHRLLDTALAEDIRMHLPPRLQIFHDWVLLYSLEQNGISLNTLYGTMVPQSTSTQARKYGYLMVIRDHRHQLFGCYVNEYLRPMDRKAYYGNGECFLWKTERSHVPNLAGADAAAADAADAADAPPETQLRLKVFPYTSLNDYVIYSNSSFISVGSGEGKFGLWIDSDLYRGASDTVETFGNEPLSAETQFKIMGLEIWRVGL